MKHILLSLLIFVLGTNLALAQSPKMESKCATRELTEEELMKRPEFGNNDYLQNILDSLESLDKGMRVERTVGSNIFEIPVQVWIYRSETGSSITPEEWHVARWLNIMDSLLEMNNVNIRLYMECKPFYITDSEYYEGITTGNRKHEDMFRDHRNPNALNMHFIRKGGGFVGVANFPDDNPPYSMAVTTSGFERDVIGDDDVEKDIFAQEVFAANMLHEFGHTLGLLHTHQGRCGGSNGNCGNCKQEYVDRERRLGGLCWAGGVGNYAAQRNGDLLRDTQADPNLGVFWVDSATCNYAPTITNTAGTFPIDNPTDNDGVTWQPPVNNVMSYSLLHCMLRDNAISRFQAAKMYDNVSSVRYATATDEYENDNSYEVANFVNIGSFPRQHHTFHANLGSGGDDISSCDEDWLQFNLTTNRKVIVVTRPASAGSMAADTYIELFRRESTSGVVSLVRVAFDDNNSQYGTTFSRIEEDNLQSGTYYVRVTNQNNSFGHYVIGIFPERENWGSYGGGGSGGTGGNPDGEIDFGVDDPFTGGDIDGDGTLDYVCNGAQLNLQGLDNDPNWSVQWSTNSSSVSAVNGFIQAGSFSGEVIITALIYYNGALVGNAMKTIWVGAPQRPTLNITGLRDNNVKCEGEPIYLSAANSTQGFATSYKWTAYKNLVQVYETTTTGSYLGVNAFIRNLPVGNYLAQVSACNECGCNESEFVSLTVIPNTDPACGSISPGRGKIQVNSIIQNEIIIYPNPVTNKLTIKLPSVYTKNSTQVELYNSIGQLVLSKSYTETNIELPVSSYPKGLYILKIQNGKEMKTEKIIIE